ncbi:LuxR family transcriptional regulator [Curtobacterium sp. MCSS17_007]|uniref:helix-turn-helix transcriptional regulator n=1 Tax=Curtobacterium sp. MCSS17_007 TaxID=2175646 RepID=UPI000DA8A8BF|nr:LuxR family transcriptional regulator [Curtobacterium sp. MCSS17_007]WIE74432.1 LuxR C-terminal-related transcriptional regulator [Curtobacterium sp. MCSS17_007]
MALTGRRLEVDRIATLAVLPRESAMVVVGDPGSGRSSVLDAVADRVSLPVVRVGVNGSESRWPLAGVTSLFTALDDPRATAHIAHLLQAGGATSGLAAAHDFLEAVQTLTLPPTVVLIDDLDRMDAESQELIGFLAGRLAGTALRLVATVRTVPSDGPLAALPVLRLEPLVADEALAVARSMAPEGANDGVLAILADATGGNPGALREQFDALTRAQLAGAEPLVLPLRPTATTEALAALTLDRLDRPDPEVGTAVDDGGDAGRGLDVLARLALVPVARTAAWDRDAVDDLADAGVVVVRGQTVAVRDPLLRSALHWRTSARTRRSLHAELAAASTECDPRAAAWHRSFVDDVPDVVALLEAAAGYVADGAPHAAVALAERALHVGSGGEDERAALLVVTEAFLAQRLLGLAARYLTAMRPFRRPTDEVRRLRALYSVQYLRGETVHADELLVPVAAEAPEAPATAGLLAMVASFRAETWDLEQARDLLARVEQLSPVLTPHTAEIAGAVQCLVAALDGTLPADTELYDGLSSARLLAMSDPALLLVAHGLSIAERHRSARRVFALVVARGQDTEAVWVEGARYLSAENELRSGNFRQALRAIDAWEAGSALSAQRLREPSRVVAVAWRHFAEGRSHDALEVVDRCLALRSTALLWGTTAQLHALRGRVLLLDGRIEEAVVALEAADAVGRSLRNPTVLRHLGDLVEGYVRLGRLDDARGTAARLAADHHARPSRWGALVLARSLALVADDTTREPARRRALELFQPHDSQYERARTFAALAAVGTEAERPRLGAAAAAAYEAAGLRRPLATPAAAVAMPSFGVPTTLRSGPVLSAPSPATPRSAPDASAVLTSLTTEERAVVQKVTEGYRNREIASSLFMSQRTVELRLTQIYRKVGARSRSHLVALLT